MKSSGAEIARRQGWRGGAILCACLLGFVRPAAAESDEQQLNPLQVTVELITNLQNSVNDDGEKEEAAYRKYTHWCDEASGAKQNEVKALLKEKVRLEASIELAGTTEKAAVARIDEFSAGASRTERKLQEFALDRKEEAAAFDSAEKTLMESIKTIDRALSILKKEMTAGASASLLQSALDTPGLQAAMVALSAVVSAAGGPEGEHVQRLASLLENQQESQEGEGEGEGEESEASQGKPLTQADSSKAGNILEVMQDLKDDCEEELKKIRDREANAQHNYMMLKQATQKQAEDLSKEMEEEKSDKAAATEQKSKGERDLQVVLNTLKKTQESLKHVQDTCIRTAADHDQSMSSRKEELKALAEAKKTLQATMASSKVTSFVQVARSGGRSQQGARAEAKKKLSRKAAAFISHLAVKQGSSELAQLAERLKAEVHTGKDPFAKVRGLIEDMLKKMKDELTASMREKEYCDSELAKTLSKQEELSNSKEDLKGKIAAGSSQSAILKAQVKDLQGELAELSKQQIDMDAARQTSHMTYVKAKENIQQGLAGVRKAIDTLREYYAADEGDAALLQTDDSSSDELAQPAAPKNYQKSTSTGNNIIGLLEVVMSDLAQSLSKEEAEEVGKDDEYQKLTQENKELAATKEDAISYKTREFKELESNIAENSNDYDTKSEELSAVEEYLAKVKERCIVAPESFEERKKRREANAAGLREALEILSGRGSGSDSGGGGRRSGFLQKRSPQQPPQQQLAVAMV